MLDKNIFFNITSNSYSQFLNYGNESKKDPQFQSDHLEKAISMHYKSAFIQRKKLNWAHLILFYVLGLIFSICALVIYFKAPNANCGLYFDKCVAVKHTIDFLCISLALGSFAIGSLIRPEKEALNFLTNKIKLELNDPSCHIQIELNSLFHQLTRQPQTLLIEDKEPA